MSTLIESPMNPTTYRCITTQLGLTDKTVVKTLAASGLIPEGETITEEQVRAWQGKGRRRPEHGGTGRRPYRFVSEYLTRWLNRIIDHEDELFDAYVEEHEKTGEPVTIYIPRSRAVIDAGMHLAQRWAPYAEALPVVENMAGRLVMRLFALGIPSRVDFCESYQARALRGHDEPAFRSEPTIF